jgi:hypothetical protein
MILGECLSSMTLRPGAEALRRAGAAATCRRCAPHAARRAFRNPGGGRWLRGAGAAPGGAR